MDEKRVLALLDDYTTNGIKNNALYTLETVSDLNLVKTDQTYNVAVIDLDLVDEGQLDSFIAQNEANLFQQYVFISSTYDTKYYPHADDLLLKTVNDLTLNARLKALIDKRHIRTMQFVYGIEVDPYTVQVYYNSASTNLTASEFFLFKYLYECVDEPQTLQSIALAIFYSDDETSIKQTEFVLKGLLNKLPYHFIQQTKNDMWQFIALTEEELQE